MASCRSDFSKAVDMMFPESYQQWPLCSGGLQDPSVLCLKVWFSFSFRDFGLLEGTCKTKLVCVVLRFETLGSKQKSSVFQQGLDRLRERVAKQQQ